MNEDEFYLNVAHALSGCQLVEQELKRYITEALQLAEKFIGGRIPFKMSGDDYANSPLGKLIETFKRLSDNEPLVAELRKFKTERNSLSHEAIIHCLDYEGELSHSTVLESQDRLRAIQNEAERLRIAIHEEASKFRGHWFDDLPQAS